MADLDWVGVRSACSLAAVFERLKGEVEEDARKRQALVPKTEFGYRYAFRTDVGQGRISVLLEGADFSQNRSIVFYLREDCIEVIDGKRSSKLKATPTISDDGECRLKVNGQERELWQFRKAALEDLFFSV
jgi:hypothetical protein